MTSIETASSRAVCEVVRNRIALKEIKIERALRISGILLILRIAVEIASLLWEKPLAFLLFVGVGGALTFLGIALYLYSLLPPPFDLRRNLQRKTPKSASSHGKARGCYFPQA